MQITSLLPLIIFFYTLTTTTEILIDGCNCTLPSLKRTIDLSDPDYYSHPEPVSPPFPLHYSISSRNWRPNHMDKIRLYSMVIAETNNYQFPSGPRHYTLTKQVLKVIPGDCWKSAYYVI